jgi:hypothetical protein
MERLMYVFIGQVQQHQLKQNLVIVISLNTSYCYQTLEHGDADAFSAQDMFAQYTYVCDLDSK